LQAVIDTTAGTPNDFLWPDNSKNVSFPWGASRPPLAHMSQLMSQLPNGISIDSAVYAQYISVTNTNRHTYHTTCDIFRNRPQSSHLRNALDAA